MMYVYDIDIYFICILIIHIKLIRWIHQRAGWSHWFFFGPSSKPWSWWPEGINVTKDTAGRSFYYTEFQMLNIQDRPTASFMGRCRRDARKECEAIYPNDMGLLVASSLQPFVSISKIHNLWFLWFQYYEQNLWNGTELLHIMYYSCTDSSVSLLGPVMYRILRWKRGELRLVGSHPSLPTSKLGHAWLWLEWDWYPV